MDKIYEAYARTINEGKMKEFEQTVKSLAKKLGVKYTADILKFHSGKLDWNKTVSVMKTMKPKQLIVGVSTDDKNPKNGQVYVIASINDKYEGFASVRKYTNNNVTNELDDIIKNIIPRPSGKDVNKAQKRFGRM